MAARGPQPQRKAPQRVSAPKPGGYHWPTGGGNEQARAKVAMQVERALTTPNRARQAARPLLNMNARPKAPKPAVGPSGAFLLKQVANRPNVAPEATRIPKAYRTPQARLIDAVANPYAYRNITPASKKRLNRMKKAK